MASYYEFLGQYKISNENRYFEFKSKDILKNRSGRLTIENIGESIVAFANRDGGTILIGVDNSGEPEGKGIFSDFGPNNQSSLDAIKASLDNYCRDKLSPTPIVDADLFELDEGDIIKIDVKRRYSFPIAIVDRGGGHIIKNRKYYIRTSHGSKQVTDEQLDWMFKNTNAPIPKYNCYISIVYYKDLGGIPFTDDTLQPRGSELLQQYIQNIVEHDFEKIKNDNGLKIQIINELLPYAILHSLQGNFYPNDVPHIYTPEPPKSSVISSLKWDFKSLESGSFKKIYVPEGTKAEIEYGHNESLMKINNDIMELELNLQFSNWSKGFNGSNPYRDLYIKNYGYAGQEKMFDLFENVTFYCEMKAKFDFPELSMEYYKISQEFVENFRSILRNKWDYDNYISNFPHYKKLYTIEDKVTRILKHLEK
ncbi:MAG: helix-turn-helix domain-containing protein [Bacillota bacterium]